MALSEKTPLGLTLAYFHRFVDDHGGRDCFQGLTTLDVCDRFVKPYTSTSHLSLVDHVLSQPRGHEYAKPAQWLISHSWSYQFLDVVDAIDGFCHEQELSPDTSFWFCLFSNNQHTIGEPLIMFEHWLQAFRSALESTGKMVMVLSPWYDPDTLKRTWCVYEVYLSIVLNARFEIAMGTSQKAEFLTDVQKNQSIQRMLGQINSSNSITTVPSDRDHIFKLIEDQVGFVQLDRMVFDVLQGWIMRTLDKQIDIATSAEDRCTWLITKASTLFENAQFAEAEPVYQAAVDLVNETPALAESATFYRGWEAQLYVAFCRAKQHQPRETWEPLCLDAFPKLQELARRDDLAIFCATMELGESYCTFGDVARGMPLLLEALELATAHHSAYYLHVIKHYIGIFCSRQNQLHEAEAMLRPAYEGLRGIYGPHHRETMAALHNLSTCYIRQGRFKLAQPLLTLNVEETSRTLGPTHLETSAKRMSLGVVWRSLGQYEAAEAHLKKSLAAFQGMGNDMWAIHCRRNVGLLCLCQGDLEQAKSLLETVHKAYLETFAPSHPFCRGVLFDRFMVSYELGSEFDAVDKINAFERLLNDANIDNDTWSLLSCHKCYAPIQGDLVVCAQCPRHSVRYCTTCTSSANAQLVCGHNDGPWTYIPPPTRHLADRKDSLMTKAQATKLDSTAKAPKATQVLFVLSVAIASLALYARRVNK